MSFKSVAQKIAAKASLQELSHASALGYVGEDAYLKAFRVLDEVYMAAFEIERPYLWQSARMITGKHLIPEGSGRRVTQS